jgi:M6 family metalloprotease-like protein
MRHSTYFRRPQTPACYGPIRVAVGLLCNVALAAVLSCNGGPTLSEVGVNPGGGPPECASNGGVSQGSTAAVGAAMGEQRFIILLVSFPSMPLLTSVTPQALQDTYFGARRSVDSYLREVSYGKAWASGAVFGHVTLDADYYDQPFAARDAAIRAASGHVDFTKYNRIVLVVPQSSAGLESGGLGTNGTETVRLYPSGSVVASTTWLGDASAGSAEELLASACHELGHNLGLGHSQAADFGSEPLGPASILPVPREYGDSFSNMGRAWGHWAAPQKAALGWLANDADVKNVETGGTFLLKPYETGQCGLKAIRVRRGTGNDAWLWLEYRGAKAGAYDSALPPTAYSGALVHYEDGRLPSDEHYSYLLRFNSDDVRGVFFGNAPLAAGNTWRDPYSNLSLAVDANLTDGLKITVSYAPAPAITVVPAVSQVDAQGGSVALNVTAPTGSAWTATSSVPWMTISSVNGNLVTVGIAPTSVTNTRWGRIVVGTAAAVVTQNGLAGAVSLAPTEANVAATGATGTINVSANANDYIWHSNSEASWIQSVFLSQGDGKGSGVLRYIVAQNTSGSPRKGTIHIDTQVFTITQAQGGPEFSLMDWNKLTITDAPIAPYMDMAPFTTRGESILYGGGANSAKDTWGWNGTAWSMKAPAHNPGRLDGHAMAYDPGHDRIVLFGGVSDAGISGATWTWDGSDWAQLHPQHSPPARTNHAMVYNPASHEIVLFGGSSVESSPANDTWEWDGTDWTKKVSAMAPPSRERAAMAYDAARNEIVLFGGSRDEHSSLHPVFFSDTWVWDGAQWRQKATSTMPTPRTGARMQYDPVLGQVVLIGGYGAVYLGVTPPFPYYDDYREETWTWDGTDWLQRFPNQSPSFAWTYAMEYDQAHHTLFAHLGDDLHCATRGAAVYVLTPGTGAVLLDSYRAEIAANGGSASFSLTGTVPWTTTSDSWIRVVGDGFGTGAATVSYVVAPNTSPTPRTGRIVVNDKTFSVSQAGAI